MPSAYDTLTVAAAQITARLMNEAPATLAALDNAITRAADKRVDLLVLPECAYPAYLLGSAVSYRTGDHLKSDEFVAWLQERAAKFRLHIISGFVEDTGNALRNAAVFIDRRGREIGRARKRFLWHADHDWFEPGDEIRAFDSEIGRVGITICAEARAPEIVASLVADGAELIALPTCWINASRDPGRYQNIQPEYLISARAREFGVPFVCADKSGLEMGAVGYVGRSQIVRSDGSVAAEAPPTGEAVIAARIRLRKPPRVWVGERWKRQILSDTPPRRPEPSERRIKLAIVPTAVATSRFTGGMGEDLFKPLQQQGVQVSMINLPQEAMAETFGMLARAFDIHALGYPLYTEVKALGPAQVGCVAGRWARTFPAARALSLMGAEILFFFDMPDDLGMLRTRAVENRVFVAGANERSAVLIAPDGSVLGQTNRANPQELVREIDLADAAGKLVAPATDVFEERRPHLYRF